MAIHRWFHSTCGCVSLVVVHFGHVSNVCVFVLLNLDVFQTFVRASRGCKQMSMLVGMLRCGLWNVDLSLSVWSVEC